MNPNRPYVVLARLDIDAEARFWIRRRDGMYVEWEPMRANLPARVVKPHRLIPAVADFETYTGDGKARCELHAARDQVERLKSE